MYYIKSISSSNDDYTVFCFRSRVPGKLFTLNAVIGIVVSEGAGLRVEAGQAFIGSQPKVVVVILNDGIDDIVWKSVFDSVPNEGLGFFIKQIQAAYGSYPNITRMIFKQGVHGIMR